MTVILQLSPEQEKRLRVAAEARGVAPDELANELMQKAIDECPEKPATKRRVIGLHPGNFWTADDFDAPLPDSFWLGEQ
jgi:hypothetical protein